eukprot:PhF_6_TR21889/c0_g1_i1/m.31084
MNWKTTATTDNAKNTIWSERCVKELRSIKPIETWRVNPGYLQRTVLSENPTKRPTRFLDNRLQNALSYSTTTSQHSGGGGGGDQSTPARAHTDMGMYASSVVSTTSASASKAMNDVSTWLRRNRMKPEDKYASPLTSGQEYGWNCAPEKSEVVLPHHRHTRHPRSSCDVTKIANAMLAASGGNAKVFH